MKSINAFIEIDSKTYVLPKDNLSSPSTNCVNPGAVAKYHMFNLLRIEFPVNSGSVNSFYIHNHKITTYI